MFGRFCGLFEKLHRGRTGYALRFFEKKIMVFARKVPKMISKESKISNASFLTSTKTCKKR